jgi:hypothetical protein
MRNLKKKHSFVRPHKPKANTLEQTDQSLPSERAPEVDITYTSF